MSNLKCNFDKAGVETLADDKPSVYQVFDGQGVYVYVGKTEAGRVIERLKEHLRDPESGTKGGVKIEIRQCESDAEATALENNLIREYDPPGNKRGGNDKAE